MINLFQIYTRSDPPCIWCEKTKNLMRTYGYDFYEIDITEPQNKKDFLEAGFKQIPQVYLSTGDGLKHIGGYETTKDFLRAKFFEGHHNKDLIIQELKELE